MFAMQVRWYRHRCSLVFDRGLAAGIISPAWETFCCVCVVLSRSKPAKLFWGLYEVGCFSNFTHDSSLYSYCYCLLFARFNASAVNRWSNLRFASFSRCIFLVSFNLLLLFHLNNLMAFWFRFWFPCRHQPLWMEPGEVSGQLRGLER